MSDHIIFSHNGLVIPCYFMNGNSMSDHIFFSRNAGAHPGTGVRPHYDNGMVLLQIRFPLIKDEIDIRTGHGWRRASC